MNKIIASSYKGKWFILQDETDEDDYPAPYIDVAWAMREGLREHVENCRYYGIPPYVGNDKDLNKKIKTISEELDKEGI